MKKITQKTIRNNITLSVCSQIISMLASFIISFILPKFLAEMQYAYWQIYFLYVSYVGLFHFGLLDGMLLRYSKYDYDELDKENVRGQFIILITFLSVTSVGLLGIARIIEGDIKSDILALIALGIIIKNVFTYSSYMFQLTNRIKQYAKLVVMQKLFNIVIVIALLLLKTDNFIWYCLADLCSDCVGIGYGIYSNSELYVGKIKRIKKVISELSENVRFGFLLLISNFAALFLVGSARIIIQWNWGELIFGKVSLSFTISNLFLLFISAISVVIFPSLKRMEQDKLPDLYITLRKFLTVILFIALLFYFPCCIVLEKWLPLYKVSFEYLGILLPSILFSTKINLLTNNYLKHYRKEGALLKINLCTVLLSCAFSLFSALVLHNLQVLLLGMVFAFEIRAIWSELIVMKKIGRYQYRDFISEFLFTIIFIMCATLESKLTGGAIYFIVLAVFLFMNCSVVNVVNKLMKKR